MKAYIAALWAEGLKARRTRVALVTAAVFIFLAVVDGLFMIILKDPQQAKELGLISVKAQLVAGVADWQTFIQVLLQGVAIGGGILFGFITAWVFGREYADHTIKEILALPCSRSTIVAAKFTLIAFWDLTLTIVIFLVAFLVGFLVDIPGWQAGMLSGTFNSLVGITLLITLTMPWVAFFASYGHGYLPAVGWAIFTMALSQIAGVLGWAEWFPWAIPALLSGAMGAESARLGAHSLVVIFAAAILGCTATLAWWLRADQSR